MGLAAAGGPLPAPGSPPVRRTRPPAVDAVDAAVAVLEVAAGLARYAVGVTTRVPRAAVGRVVADSRSAAARELRHLADALVPPVVRAVLSRLDVAGLVQEFVDVDRLAAQLDVNAVAARLDLDVVLARLDIDAIAAGLDLDALVEKVDTARVLDRIDVDAVVDRVDLDRIVERLDLGAIVDRVDVDRIIDRADVVAVARYVIQEIDLPEIIRSSTGSITTEVVRSVRDQGVDADRAVERVVDRLLLRRHGRRVAGTAPVDGPPGPGHDQR